MGDLTKLHQLFITSDHTCDTKKYNFSGDFLLSTILPMNGPKRLPSGICIWANIPALRNSGGRWESSSCTLRGLPVKFQQTTLQRGRTFLVCIRPFLNFHLSKLYKLQCSYSVKQITTKSWSETIYMYHCLDSQKLHIFYIKCNCFSNDTFILDVDHNVSITYCIL